MIVVLNLRGKAFCEQILQLTTLPDKYADITKWKSCMKTSHLLLVATLGFATLVPVACAQSSNSPPSPTSTLAHFKQLIAETKTEITNAEADAKTAAEELSKAAPDNRAASQQKLDAAQAKLDAVRQKLAALEEAEAVLGEQGPVRLMIADLKRQRDALPSPGTDGEKARRSELDRQITALEGADATVAKPGLGALEIIIAIVIAVAVVGALLCGLVYLWNMARQAAKQEDEATARIRLAKAVTLGAMTFIVVISAVTLLFAGVNAAVAPEDKEKTQHFFDMAKWVLGTVLPVVGAWVGGVLAYYFGKENFKAGAENAEKLVMQLTPQQKLESKKAGDSGLDMADPNLAVHRLAPGADIKDTKLTDLESAYKKGGETYERLPIVDANGSPVACLHQSTLSKYTKDLTDAEKLDPTKMTLDALVRKLVWKPEASFATVLPTDSLTRAQELMNANKECSDVFVTPDGTKAGVAKRWITNDDILKIANA